ncbi:Vitamin B12-dependent ribonucleotide reductase [Sedimentisphaera cyanobacteriorum]|uniref:Vitamin B12-dependent ribonucleotide reductase n=1 Tax=Sedimentisphaera cyanobacteriorum TaxID=1940790 RepID=A0A1Q2HP06_9BACT|nr:vitamin B12-dependent ribonucleotide reductase [Sedimentisphaera cyanobacteriorum]AQQ09014.1 Vitamin B12-dependent ribonucleotide reductase [Sedimentisphaera cyanobacteriorum]
MAGKAQPKNISVKRYFSTEGKHPFDQIEWENREAVITDEKGNVIFKQEDIETPKNWSQLAAKIVVSKYFYGEAGTEQREKSIKQLIHRVARTIADRGYKDGYFTSQKQRDLYYEELAYLCVNQYGAFNSPVWFNLGLKDEYGVEGSPHNFHYAPEKGESVPCENTYTYPQCSACFIQSVEDTMEDIMRLANSEAMLFKHGSGTGTDLSTLRSSREKLSGGGIPSGPLSFMKVFDQIAGVIKSGGKTRRAAKMQSLMADHPDIKDFINSKLREEKKAWALIEQGYSGDFNGEAYGSVMFQNANLSVRVTDEFMKAVESDSTWTTKAVTSGKEVDTYNARELMDEICEGTRVCGDPGLQYHSTINKWHTCPNEAPINASNPCSEYMFINNSACNLASLNLMKFRNEDGSFDVESFKKAVKIFIIAQEILVDNGSYPEKKISDNSHKFRPLGLGYANLGCLMMSLAHPYDSEPARELAGAITAIMTGTAYEVSSELAVQKGTFEGYEANKEPMLNVISMHRDKAYQLKETLCPRYLVEEAKNAWDRAYDLGTKFGYRNSQTTVLAPTGTIGFMMDCDTTGIEPDIALVKYKMLAGGGMIKYVNQTVPMALDELGYSKEEIEKIKEEIDRDDTIETSEILKKEHLPVFDCAFKARKGKRSIPWMAHLKMMSAAQPFLSGAISKTINMPNESTNEDIMQAYTEGWKMGLKAVAVYRDGSKRTQPLNTGLQEEKQEETKVKEVLVKKPYRRRLPETRCSITHKFSVAGHEGYLTVGLYDDGQPGELFITMAKEGSTVGGLMDVIGTCTSLSLQYGVPLVTLVDKFRHARFEPAGMTSNKDMPFAKSLIDYIFCWLGCQFLPGYAEKNTPHKKSSSTIDLSKPLTEQPEDEQGKKPSTGSNQAGKQKEKEAQKTAKQPAFSVTETSSTDGAAEKLSIIGQFNKQFDHFQDDAPACDICGSITVRNGTCYRCHNCGNSMGCS